VWLAASSESDTSDYHSLDDCPAAECQDAGGDLSGLFNERHLSYMEALCSELERCGVKEGDKLPTINGSSGVGSSTAAFLLLLAQQFPWLHSTFLQIRSVVDDGRSSAELLQNKLFPLLEDVEAALVAEPDNAALKWLADQLDGLVQRVLTRHG
jgi:hypothetical protein